MDIFLPEHQELLRHFVLADVAFMLIGGNAVIYHGYGRSTGNMDLWIRPDNDNKRRLIKALGNAGFDEELLEELGKLDFDKHQVITFDEPPHKVDILTRVRGVDFDEAYKDANEARPDGVPIKFIHLHHLILSKINTGGAQDKADIDELQKVASRQNKKGGNQ